MADSRAARWRTRLRTTQLGARLAIALWAVWAFCVWNVVFDRVLVLAGRRYSLAAHDAAQSNTFLRIDDWMRPAVVRGFWDASAAGALVLAVGVAAVLAACRGRATSGESPRKS